MTIRHFDLINEKDLEKTKVHIFGAGSIGSYTALALAKIGFPDITVYDFDTVDEENLAVQFYNTSNLKNLKTTELRKNIFVNTGNEIRVKTYKLNENLIADELLFSNIDGIVISAVDCMEARKTILDLAINMSKATHFIDSRMAIQTFVGYAVSLLDVNAIETYKKSLFSNLEAIQEPCTNKAIAFTSMIAGGLVAKLTVDCVKSKFKYKNFSLDIDAYDSLNFTV